MKKNTSTEFFFNLWWYKGFYNSFAVVKFISRDVGERELFNL